MLYKGFVVPYLFAFFFWPILYGNPQSALGETSPSETKDPCGEHSREEAGSSTSCSADAIQQQLKDRLFKENNSIKKERSSLAEEEFQREKIAYPILQDLYSRTEVIEKICSEEFWKDNNPVCIGGLTLAEKAKEKNLLKSHVV